MFMCQITEKVSMVNLPTIAVDMSFKVAGSYLKRCNFAITDTAS